MMTSLFGVKHSESILTILYTIVFGISLFIQCLIFHYLVFNSILVSSIIYAPVTFWAFYLPKISICCFLSFLVPLFRKKGWTIICSVIIGVWILSELIYYRVNGILLDAFSFTMIGNMSGFWNGVFAFVRPNDLIILLPTLLLMVCFLILLPHAVSKISTVIFLFLSVGIHISGIIVFDKQQVLFMNCNGLDGKTNRYYNPFSEKGSSQFGIFSKTEYARQTSVIHCLVLDVWDLVKMPFCSSNLETLSSEYIDLVQSFFNIKTSQLRTPTPNGNLYIILFESFENWSISPLTTPVIFDFIQNHDNILWAKKIAKQTKGGTSADGQMIVNTGVLPILDGATCYRFPGNCFPSLSELYNKSALIQPGNMAIWNQKRMSDAYHITDNFVIPDSNDAITFSKLLDIYCEYPYVIAVSMASHTPFDRYSNDKKLDWNSDMPDLMRRYLDCVHYTDSCLKDFLERVDTDETLKNSTIVITGDHTIFDDVLRDKFNDYCVSQGEQYAVKEAYCPLIVYSPSIQEKTIIEDVKYQMDIFPTALYAIGCENSYYWKGFGVNLYDRDAKREITEEQAFILSDKMIQSDYWRYINRYSTE